MPTKKRQGRPPLSPEARERIAVAATQMHARRRAAKEAGGRAAELRKIADILDTAMQLSPESRSTLKQML